MNVRQVEMLQEDINKLQLNKLVKAIKFYLVKIIVIRDNKRCEHEFLYSEDIYDQE